MDSVFEALFSWQFILFCLGVAAITFIFRKGVEFFVLDSPKVKADRTSKFWREFVLPVFPIIFGTLAAFFAKQYPYPADLNITSGRLAFGLVAGMLSSIIYKLIKGFLGNKLTDLVNKNKKEE